MAPDKTKRFSFPDYNGTITASELRRLPKHGKMEVMRTWFFENFEDPVHNAPWVDGEYVYIHGGPYDAAEELHAKFSGLVAEGIIDELAEELSGECTEWTKHPEYEPDDSDYPLSPTQPVTAFNDSIKATNSLLQVSIPAKNQQHFLRLLYGSVITALETYLSDFFIAIITQRQWYLRTFVEKNKDFAEQKFALNEIYTRVAQIEKKSITFLRDILWHDLAKVSKIYASTLNLNFPPTPELYKAISIRHDIVHRSGKTKEGIEHKLKPIQIENLIAQAEVLVVEIEKQWKNKEEAERAELFGDDF